MANTTHPKCGKAFPGGNQAGHCGKCCETFIGNTAFEAHRIGEHGTPQRRCEIQPEESVNDNGRTVYGHWLDARGYWHYGRKLTDAEKAEMWPTQ